jgi:hypothetical protein
VSCRRSIFPDGVGAGCGEILTGDGPRKPSPMSKTTQEKAPVQARPRASRPRTVQKGGTQYTHVKEWSAQL